LKSNKPSYVSPSTSGNGKPPNSAQMLWAARLQLESAVEAACLQFTEETTLFITNLNIDFEPARADLPPKYIVGAEAQL